MKKSKLGISGRTVGLHRSMCGAPNRDSSDDGARDVVEHALYFLLVALGLIGALVFCVVYVNAEWIAEGAQGSVASPSEIDVAVGGDKKKGWGTGTFGDAFGVATSIFTAAAFLGLFLSIRVQRKELEEIRRERRAAEDTLSRQIKQSVDVEKEMRKKNFEERAFRLLEVIRERTQDFQPRPLIGQAVLLVEIGGMPSEYLDTLLSRLAQDRVSPEEARQHLKSLFRSSSYYELKRKGAAAEIVACLRAFAEAELITELYEVLASSVGGQTLDYFLLLALENEFERWVDQPHLSGPI